MEKTVVSTVESGVMTKDLAICIHGNKAGKETYVNTEKFIDVVA